MKLTQKLQRIVCRGFFHRIFANNYRNERASNFPCKNLFTSHLFTHTRHASFYLKKQKYNTRIGRTRHCVVLCSYRAILIINLLCPPLRARFINCTVLGDLVLLSGAKRNIPSPRQLGNPWCMSDSTACALREKKKGDTADSAHCLSLQSKVSWWT